MGKMSLTTTSSSLSDWINELDLTIEELPNITKESLMAQQEVYEEAIKRQYVSMGGTSNGFVASSIGQSSFIIQGQNVVVGTVGVYHMDRVSSQFGKTGKDLNAAQIAYWIENGTSRLRSGERKKKNAEYSDEDLITIQPRPFISSGVYSSFAEGEDAYKKKFNELYDKLVIR